MAETAAVPDKPDTEIAVPGERGPKRRNKSRITCCVPMCTTPGYVTEDGHEVTFHKLPLKDKDRLRDWIAKIRRDLGPCFSVTEHTRICSRHFKKSDFRTTYKGKRYLNDNAVPSTFPWSKVTKERSSRCNPLQTCSTSTSVDPDQVADDTLADDSRPVGSIETGSTHIITQQLVCRISQLEAQLAQERERNNIITKERDHVRQLLSTERSQAAALTKADFNIEHFKKSDADVCFYTGFPTFTTFMCCFQFLNPEGNITVKGNGKQVNILKEKQLSYMNQFFLILVRLRLGLLEKDLAHRFKISQPSVHRYITSWVNFMYLRLGSINIWPGKEAIVQTMPMSMKDKFPNLEWIIDAFEIQMQRPASLMLQSQSYSSYKSRNTVKGLVACTPSGQIGFVSQLYTGNISDRELVRRSGFLKMPHNKGASWLVDKGFQIQDLADEFGVTVNMPAFVGKKGFLSTKEVFLTQSIASERIHIERAINKIKKFHIFDRPIAISTMGSINQMWTVCALLTLFQNPIISA